MKKAADIIWNPGEAYSVKNRKWQGVPSIERTGSRLWAAWMTGGKYEPSTNNYGLVAYSDDDGENWIEPYIIVACNPADGQRAYEHQLWFAPDGKLWLFWCQDIYAEDAMESDFDTPEEDLVTKFFCETQTWAMYTNNPEDATPIWSEPIFLAQGATVRNKPIVLKNGDTLIPGYDVNNEKFYQYLISHDYGRTVEVKEGPVLIGEKEFDECMAVEREDGSIWFLARTLTGHIAESFSYDGGKTWTQTRESDIPNPATRFYIGRLKNRMLLLVNTPSSVRGDRKGLIASLSMDDGRTWSYHLQLDDRRSTTYPDVAEGADGSVYVIYDCQRSNRQEICKEDAMKSTAAKEICMAKFTIEDIKNQEITNPHSYTGRIISKSDYSSRELG